MKIRSLVFLVLHFQFLCESFAQDVKDKKLIDSSMFGTWSRADHLKISNDGHYVAFVVSNEPIESNTLSIQSIDKKWKFAAEGVAEYEFTDNCKQLIYHTVFKELHIVKLGDSIVKSLSCIESFKVSHSLGNQWLAYLCNGTKSLDIINLGTGNTKRFETVIDYLFNPQGSALIIKASAVQGIKLSWANLKNDSITTFWNGKASGTMIFDNSGSRIAFQCSKDTSTPEASSLWYFSQGSQFSELIFNGSLILADTKYLISMPVRFTLDGQKIFILLQRLKPRNAPAKAITSVDIWSYTDSKLQSQQLYELNAQQQYVGILHIATGTIMLPEGEGEKLRFDLSPGQDKVYLLLKNGRGDLENEWNWNLTARCDVFLYSMNDGEKQLISSDVLSAIAYGYQVSPSNKYVVFYDPTVSGYCSFNVATKATINLTAGIKTSWTSFHHSDEPDAKYRPYEIVGFVKDKDQVLVCDQRDIFNVDLTGKKKPVCITNGLGKEKDIEFRLIPFLDDRPEIVYGRTILLSSFNHATKDNGFYSVRLDRIANPHELSTHSSLITGPVESAGIASRPIIKSKYNNVFVITKENAHSSPNYFYTQDFKVFNSISEVYPEKSYVWLTSELINWKTLEGKKAQGILYKPENFDSKKKYPIIFYFYERNSEGLHQFLTPGFSLGRINIPFFVSNDYLVFVPDIPKKVGYPGWSALSSVVSAAKYFIRKPWIDRNHIGIQGHSFGGFETNYIVTHSNLFAAAVSAASMSNFISCYGSIMWLGDGSSRQRQYEIRHDAMGGSLWDISDRYIDNSPVLEADKVTTPILMMNNISDGDVPFAQGVELFTALRRLGKRAWMLQYDEGGHLIFGSDAIDYTIRMKQFYDHYLKNAPAPAWMLRGMPAKLKGLETGFELVDKKDPKTGKWFTPSERGLLINEERKKIDANRRRKLILKKPE